MKNEERKEPRAPSRAASVIVQQLGHLPFTLPTQVLSSAQQSSNYLKIMRLESSRGVLTVYFIFINMQ